MLRNPIIASNNSVDSHEPLLAQRVRCNAARWVFLGYIFLSLLGTGLHLFWALVLHKVPVVWGYLLPTLGVGLAAFIGLRQLPRSLTRAMQTFIVLGTLAVLSLLLSEIQLSKNYVPIMAMFHVSIFTLGLILGFRPAMSYATVITIVLIVVGVVYNLRLDEILVLITLAYAAALPAKIVEQLIQESTAETARVNEQLRTENAERRRAEAELEQHKEHLAELIQERTLELEASNAELDAFAHTVAHGIKNSLSSLVTVSNLLEERYSQFPEERIAAYLHGLAQDARKIDSIIDELLLLSGVRKLEEIPQEPLDMGSVVANAIARLDYLIEVHHAEIVLPEAWPVALGYGPWVEEVWANYLSNAIKYGGESPRVTLGARAEPQKGVVHYWVSDSGPGIPLEQQAQLFTPFTRLDQVQTEGYGLGLSIVRRIVHRLGGEVDLQSEPGEGSTFIFTLPLSGLATQ